MIATTAFWEIRDRDTNMARPREGSRSSPGTFSRLHLTVECPTEFGQTVHVSGSSILAGLRYPSLVRRKCFVWLHQDKLGQTRCGKMCDLALPLSCLQVRVSCTTETNKEPSYCRLRPYTVLHEQSRCRASVQSMAH